MRLQSHIKICKLKPLQWALKSDFSFPRPSCTLCPNNTSFKIDSKHLASLVLFLPVAYLSCMSHVWAVRSLLDPQKNLNVYIPPIWSFVTLCYTLCYFIGWMHHRPTSERHRDLNCVVGAIYACYHFVIIIHHLCNLCVWPPFLVRFHQRSHLSALTWDQTHRNQKHKSISIERHTDTSKIKDTAKQYLFLVDSIKRTYIILNCKVGPHWVEGLMIAHNARGEVCHALKRFSNKWEFPKRNWTIL